MASSAQNLWAKYGTGGYPIIWLQAIAAIVAALTSAFTEIDPIIAATITQISAAVEGTRRVTTVDPEDRGLRTDETLRYTTELTDPRD